jgi:hypothetical protein
MSLWINLGNRPGGNLPFQVNQAAQNQSKKLFSCQWQLGDKLPGSSCYAAACARRSACFCSTALAETG